MSKLTKTIVDRLPLPEKGYSIHIDTELKGFGVRVTPSGIKTFYLEKRINGKPRRIKIGRHGDITAEQARKEAIKLAGDIAKGGDPVAEKQRKKLASRTLNEVFADYLESRKNLKPATVKDMRRALDEGFPDWCDKPISKISHSMIEKRHQEYGERSNARANLSMRYLRALFNFAAAKYKDTDGNPLFTHNPVKALSETRAWYRVDRRQTVIKPHELGTWVNAVLALSGADIRDYFMTVLLTGMRREEALKLTWADVDLTGKTLIVRDPKNRRDHTLPLSDYLMNLFTRRKAIAMATYVFADSRGRPISNFRYAQTSVERASGVSFCIHDLRRTFATIAESLDIPAYALKRLLNHADGTDVTAGYIVANVERLREPMQKITDFVLKRAAEINEPNDEVTA